MQSSQVLVSERKGSCGRECRGSSAPVFGKALLEKVTFQGNSEEIKGECFDKQYRILRIVISQDT